MRSWGIWALPVGIALVGCALSVWASLLDLRHERQEQWAEVHLQLSAVVARAHDEIRTVYSETEGVLQLINVDGDISPRHFHGMAEHVMVNVPYIRHLAIAPDDVIRDIYPLAGNDAALGLDYRTLPGQYASVRRARALGQTILAGPVQLRQGGMALIYRRPVFVSGHSGHLRYWGTLGIITDIEGLLRAAGLLEHPQLRLAVRGGDGKGAQGELIHGQARLFDEPSARAPLDVPGGQWEIAAQPMAGWEQSNLGSSPLFWVCMVATSILTAFALALSRQHLQARRRNLELSYEITEREIVEAELIRQAHHDAVTSLPNRVLFQQRLAHSIEQVQRQGGFMAVLLLDLDCFKEVNDTLGHSQGDDLLVQASRRFAEHIHPWDTLARLGGDEFAFILDRLNHPSDSIPVVQRLLQAAARPFVLGSDTALVSASIGVAICPADGASPLELLRHADTAMYGAKEAGRNDFRYYQASMTTRIQERVAMEHALRRALQRDEFELWYQPRIDLASGRVQGAEALLRWRDPAQGLIYPDLFIPVAERTGLIVPIGQWVLDNVCVQQRRWRTRGVFEGRIAINVATPQIERSDFVTSVSRALQLHGLPAHSLEVEVTESLLMQHQDLACQVLHQLQRLGVHTAIDDFGTGHSSLAYLKLLPVNHLKVDRAFVKDLPGDSTYAAITQAVVDLGRALGFEVTAEGIETAEQWEHLRDIGCQSGQGYYIGRPMPAADFEQWLARYGTSHRQSSSNNTVSPS
ncbi:MULTISPECIES: bifunctional diguanylate cyclase/phosphodiesterase [unclassified Pseudomonas]|uniref:putative bifunctional diguanylate cyclase/phosphodiesterase n=1 Tax=unclassified Pseudomonas TaxID=196821 RepID=UPI000BD15EEF|nr:MULTISPECIES: EAL domain-containing protein [unclassified Pseudomonas]PVZ19840.1 diguanylate cyclase (GGDEF)-like protein [Pseudomonas sp. URIL14HWK12:I12]PVZ26906.1 diguanylate cyclase (GGDEF)-like protein [Pseudomonas sp. URIL14HWK12:I10]PVZ37795.1 diguanylate cyclase (GGDEF)-like protein [Pseudomonas sp. URIL14HWK12:I11]SNZ05638.1 diguanylate cyclase (GGDEF) domain-containing protein [Pseudomonas sp. URIL14HWK12:I9]